MGYIPDLNPHSTRKVYWYNHVKHVLLKYWCQNYINSLPIYSTNPQRSYTAIYIITFLLCFIHYLISMLFSTILFVHPISTGDGDITCICVVSLIARFMGPTWGPYVPTGPGWAPFCPHELCHLGRYAYRNGILHIFRCHKSKKGQK